MEFRILGPLEVYSGGQPIRIGGPRQQRLLAQLLLAANRVVPVERLVDEVWDSPPQSVRQQLHNAIGSLRRTLAEHSPDVRITWNEVGYQLAAPKAAIDLNQFSSHIREAKQAENEGRLADAVTGLRAALDLWRGDPLAGLDGTSIENAAAVLHENRLTAVEDLMSLRLRAGETSSVIGELRQHLAEHPLRDSLRISLMQALHLSGRQADALVVYDEGRRMLSEQLGLDPSPRLRETHAMVLRGAGDPVPEPTLPEPHEISSRSPVARSYLPYDTNDFSGRSAELAELLAVTHDTSPTAIAISAVDGMGGVGKTTLAVHLGHKIAADYPDGQYFIDLHGFTAGADPVSSEQALDTLLANSGLPPEIVPSTLDGRVALWRSRIAGQRFVLIIDNAVDAAHVRPLLPGTAGALVVVTSRRKLTALEGATPMSLDVLPPEDAVTLFTRIVGVQRAAVDQPHVKIAVELCGYLPLAIRIAAARLRDRAGWTAADLVNRLRDHAQRAKFLQVEDRNVMAALKVSYRYLPSPRQRMFRLLSLNPAASFDAYVAAALTGLPLDEAEDHLDALFNDNLLRQNSRGRFQFHDLIRDCSRQLLTAEEDSAQQQVALARLLDYYLHATHMWCQGLRNTVYRDVPQVDHVPKYVRTANTDQESLELLNEEYGNITAVAQFAADNKWHRHAWQLACTLQPLLKLHNYGGRAYELFKGGAEAARATGDVRGESACLQGLSAVCRDHRSHDEAVEHIERALELSRQSGNLEDETAQLVDLGNLYLHDNRFIEARDIFHKAEPLTISTANTFLNLAVANNLGLICRNLGEFDQAVLHLRQAERLVTAEDTRAAQFISWSIGSVLHAAGAYEEALREFNRGLDAAAGISYSEALALLGLCGVNRSLGNLSESLDQGRRALTLARRHELRYIECEVLNSLGETALAMNDLIRAEQSFTHARELAERSAWVGYHARAAEGLAHVAFVRGRLSEARMYWEHAIETHPAGVVDVRYAQLHLERLDDQTTVCHRCDVTTRRHATWS